MGRHYLKMWVLNVGGLYKKRGVSTFLPTTILNFHRNYKPNHSSMSVQIFRSMFGRKKLYS